MATFVKGREASLKAIFTNAIQHSAQVWLNPDNGFLPSPSQMGYGDTPEKKQLIYNKIQNTLQLIEASPDAYSDRALNAFEDNLKFWDDFVQQDAGGDLSNVMQPLIDMHGGQGIFAQQVYQSGQQQSGVVEGNASRGNRMIDYLAGITSEDLFS